MQVDTTGPRHTFVFDDGGDGCYDPFGWWCHYQALLAYDLNGLQGDTITCPTSCRTWPLVGFYKMEYYKALTPIRPDPACAFAGPFLNQLFLNGQTRFFSEDTPDDGDFHRSRLSDGHPDYQGRIHVWDKLFEPANLRSLAVTLVHEAWHGMYGRDDIAAEAEAQACVY